MKAFLALCAAAILYAGCSGADVEDPGECVSGYHKNALGECVPDEVCEQFTCSAHGDCDAENGVVTCDCYEGYAGDRCSACAPGYERDHLGNCVQQTTECTPDSCSGHGDCDDSSGRVICDCYTGWTGAGCDHCDLGYHLEGDFCVPNELCQADSCGLHGTCDDSGGQIECLCETGYSGPTCEECAAGYHEFGHECLPDTECLPNTCNQHGTCDDSGAQPFCTCDDGYFGLHCDECTDGYHLDPAGNCVINESCQPDSCSHHGDCDDSDGEILCTCHEGYAGTYCDSCASGYQDDGFGNCVQDQDCSDALCNWHGSCEEVGGVTVCHCNDGYSGPDCGQCAPGWHPDGNECYEDTTCIDTTCDYHGTCDDSSSQPVCDCDFGYTGPNCEECMFGFHENDQGICVPIQPEVICDDGIDNDEDGDTDCQDLECLVDDICGSEDCIDNFDNDGDELTDCWDPNCAGVPACEVCTATSELQCGSQVSGSNSGGSLMNEYPSCSDWEETGPEVVYSFYADHDMHVDAKLTNMNADLDIFVLTNSCNPNTCKEQGSSEAFFGADVGTTYYIVVDGYDGETGNYTLTITCE